MDVCSEAKQALLNPFEYQEVNVSRTKAVAIWYCRERFPLSFMVFDSTKQKLVNIQLLLHYEYISYVFLNITQHFQPTQVASTVEPF